MAFGKGGPEDEVRRPVKEVETSGGGKLNSIFGQGSKINGKLTIQGSIRIDGEFEGQLEASDTLIVGKTGRVTAEVTVKRAVIGGQVEADHVGPLGACVRA